MLLSYGPFFFALNYPWPVGADGINIPHCAGEIVNIIYPQGLSFLRLISPRLSARTK